MELIASFDPDTVYSGDGHVIGLLFGNNATTPAVYPQGEEVQGIVIVDIMVEYGEWQYALCSDTPNDFYSACSVLQPHGQELVQFLK